jgi:hypothetical protein
MDSPAVAATATVVPRPRAVRRAAAIALVSAFVGIVVQLLFYRQAPGINFPLAMMAILAASWFVPERPVRWPELSDLWLPIAAVALATFVALRGDPSLVALDLLGSVTLATLSIASFGGMRVVMRPFAGIFVLGMRCVGFALSGAVIISGALRERLPLRHAGDRLQPMSGVLRGLLLAVPLVVLFIALFASADAVFGSLLGDFPDVDLGSLPGRAIIAIVAGWLTAGLMAFVAGGADEDRADEGGATRRWLGVTEAMTVLILLDVLFAAFVAVQATYLFGGQDTLSRTGLTYAEYARRGFFELLAVAFVVGALVLGLEAFIGRRTAGYRVAVIALIGLTLAVLGSAFLRLRLYQDAYGWTELRFYVLAAIVWLAIGAVAAIAAILRDATRWLPHSMVVLAVAFGLAFNVIGPSRFIAQQNVGRLSDPDLPADAYRGLDAMYLSLLGDDALIVLAERDPSSLPHSARADVHAALYWRAQEFISQPADEWQSWNLARERIRQLLSEDGLLR